MREKNRKSSFLHVRLDVYVFVVLTAVLLVRPTIAQLNVWQPNGPVHGNFWGYLAIAADPVKTEKVYTGTYHTANGYEGVLFRSNSGGPPWSNSSTGLNGSPILKIVIDRLNPSIVYAATYYTQYGIYKSIDGGASWYSINSEGYTWSFRVARSDPSILYAVGDELRVSYDRGNTWVVRDLPSIWDGDVVAVDPFNANVILVAICEYYGKDVCNPRLYRSLDGGLSWSPPILDPTGDVGFGIVEFDPLRPNVVYVVSDNPARLYKSQDLGTTWTSQPIPGAAFNLEFDPHTPTVMYAVGTQNLSRSLDGGVTWTPFTAGIPPFGPGFLDLDFSADGRFIYAATSTGTFKVQVRDEVPGIGQVSGRVTNLNGRGVRGAIVSAIDSRGNQRWSVTNPFGYYTIRDVPTTITYRAYITSKSYRFNDKIVQVDGNMTDINFIEVD